MDTMTDSKETNPKDAIGAMKLPLDLVPESLACYAAVSFAEGALKYGKFNWRVTGVRASIYIAALRRHLGKWADGEWEDQDTGVPHLASVLACAGILLDAHTSGKLVDDRAPSAPTNELIEHLTEKVAHLKELYADRHPHQHTIMDQTDRGTP